MIGGSNMKGIKLLLSSFLIAGAVLLGAKFYTNNQSDELSGVIDQLNPLVAKGTVYVKTKEADAINEYGIATYHQIASDGNGKKREILFTADHELQKERYLKVYNKGAHIETYEEVDKEEVPEKALIQLDN
jgi:uncharacterized protein (TIGR01655 family)